MTSAFGQVLEQSVVVFSQNYLLLCRINIKRAIVLLVTNKAEPLDFIAESGWQVYSPSLVLCIPKHIRLKIASGERVWKVPPVNRRSVLRPDHHSCQYCSSSKHLTLDHLIPRSKRGEVFPRQRWTGLYWRSAITHRHLSDEAYPMSVVGNCNGSHTLFETGMQLRTKPKAPVYPAISFAEQFWCFEQANLE